MKQVNTLLQQVNDSLDPDQGELPDDLKLRFPRGQIRTAGDFREKLKCVDNKKHKKNISYHLLLSDVFSWIINRTDVYGTVKEMIIKYEIVNMASIAEILSHIHGKEKFKFKKRVSNLHSNKKVEEKTMNELHWLWDTRNNVHLDKPLKEEYGIYTDADFDRAVFAVRMFIKDLEKTCV